MQCIAIEWQTVRVKVIHMKKIMITGASGFLGSRAAEYFRGKYEVMTPSHIQLDITDEKNVMRYFSEKKPDIVIHCAAVSDVGRCEREQELSWKINVSGSINIAKAAASVQTKCILCSSDQIYFGSSLNEAHKECEDVIPYNLYGREKRKAEEECLRIDQDCVCLRLSWMYDVRSENKEEHGDFFRTLLPKLRAGEAVSYPVHDIRGITDVNEVIRNMEKVFDLPGGVYNFGSPNEKNTYEILYGVFESVGLDLNLLQKNEEAFLTNPRNISMNQDKLNGAGIWFRDTSDGIAQNIKAFHLTGL